jgi:hypothetical protein
MRFARLLRRETYVYIENLYRTRGVLSRAVIGNYISMSGNATYQELERLCGKAC